MNITDIQTAGLRALCQTYKVRELYAFGSLARGELSPTSDLDFVVNFERAGPEGAFDQFMGFKQGLEDMFGRPVDLLTLKPFRNPIFQAEVDRTKTLVYAA